MYNNPYYSPQASLDRINSHINELEKMKQQLQQPPAINQTFQLAANGGLRTADSIEQVQKELVISDTPYFSKDMSILWLKYASGDVKTYELKEIIKKDEKDLQIEFLMTKIEELEMKTNAKSSNDDINEPIESEKPSNVSNGRASKTKSK